MLHHNDPPRHQGRDLEACPMIREENEGWVYLTPDQRREAQDYYNRFISRATQHVPRSEVYDDVIEGEFRVVTK